MVDRTWWTTVALTPLLGATWLGATCLAATPATAGEDPVFLGWTGALPPTVAPYQPSSENDCSAGRIQCADVVIKRMQRHLDDVAENCHHNAIFALTYLRTTETYRAAAVEPGFFADPRFVNHEDVVFADYYFRAYDDWSAGRADLVPEAWRIAFAAADAKKVTGSGNLLLGINAHVNRDLPYVLASIGLVRPDGASRKPDHDKVNVFLNRVSDPLLREAAARFDPALDDAQTPYHLSYTALFQQLAAWREVAWRNAEWLVNAPDAAARARVAQEIEDYAAASARDIVARSSYQPPLSDSTARDAFCASHG